MSTTSSTALTPRCPWGYKWSESQKRCVDTVAGVDRLTASTPTFPTSMDPTAPMPATTQVNTMSLNDLNLGSLGGVAMTILNVLTVVGAVGGIMFVYKSGYVPFLKPKRKRK